MTTTASGLSYMDLAVGDGDETVYAESVTVHYIGWFLDGEKFDSSLDRGDTFSFDLGTGGVIAGWHEGVAGMRVGGKRRLVIPPDLAYGAAGRPGIPPNSTLVFDVELFKVGGN
jgi:FKBP-type peptidyl-prolyl cis-trans isomerase FkpA